MSVPTQPLPVVGPASVRPELAPWVIRDCYAAGDVSNRHAAHQPRTSSQPRSMESNSQMRSAALLSPTSTSNQPLLTPVMF